MEHITVVGLDAHKVKTSVAGLRARELQAVVVNPVARRAFTATNRATVLAAFAALVLRAVVEPVRRGHKRRVADAQWHGIDNRLLADIGLTRSDITRMICEWSIQR